MHHSYTPDRAPVAARRRALAHFLIGAALSLAGLGGAHADTTLLNVSYDPTRELYAAYNPVFAAHWKQATGETVTIKTSNGGSGSQSRAVIDGLAADVVTLALAYDIDAITDKTGKIPKNWQSRLPDNSAPYTSTIVFLVRKGNPKHIRDWDDLVRKGVQVIAPNPKTSGGARWNYLAAWGYELKQQLGDLALLKDPAAGQRVAAAQEKAKEFVGRLYKNVPVLDSGARGSTNTFVKRGIGDVLLSWENEALLAKYRLKGDFDIVVPSISILAEPPVAVVDGNADKHGAGKVARAYLEYLYSPAGQKIAAANYYRPLHPEYADAKDLALLPKVPLFKLQDVFGDWRQVQKTHFADGGIFDQIYLK
ncbi:sulfate ABC transporter substrate-binding protein [Candidimonas humi]|jgi:sulfate transport system substrate-binding protein|uniref:Sulfate ABC transporter substrate-binding protein n=1 Tax=Candidimonas humi TaxID=683355 RepID=A0ABV8P4I8_9BURK|nr:sulfate ABC transporter substrate-binding protein [Candidimonas humi]MBV6307230.1 sulfate ABC transporter substrate-binding protein [Candidimonas humi]